MNRSAAGAPVGLTEWTWRPSSLWKSSARRQRATVSGQYMFRSETSIVFTVHDYKATTLWATDEDLPTPEAFWQLHAAQEFSIGSCGLDAKAFREWLLGRYRTWLAKQSVTRPLG